METKTTSVAPLTAKSRLPFQPAQPWLDHLKEHGFVVIQGVLEPERVQLAAALLKRDMEHVTTEGHHGISGALAHSEGAWVVRRSPNVRQAFFELWETNALLVSMDCVIARRAFAEAGTEGLHLDQNPFSKPYKECVQGMVPLLAVTPATGGLEVVPGSHDGEKKKRQKECRADLEDQVGGHLEDWCMLGTNQVPSDECIAPFLTEKGKQLAKQLEEEALLLCAEPGDLILFDSRTVHGGRVPDNQADTSGLPTDFHRMACTVCMTPKAFADPETMRELRNNGTRPKECRQGMSTAILEKRVEKFQKQTPTNHCPHDDKHWTMHQGAIARHQIPRDQIPHDVMCLLFGDRPAAEPAGSTPEAGGHLANEVAPEALMWLKVKNRAELMRDAEAAGVAKEAICDVLDADNIEDELIKLFLQEKAKA